MGAYSSFAMLALSNHVIMHIAGLVSEVTIVKGKGMYAILGDDVLINNSQLSASYVQVMSSYLGVVINPTKGFTGNVLEFAKRLIHTSGVELTPFGGKVLLRFLNDPMYLSAVLADYFKKGFNTILNLELSVL